MTGPNVELKSYAPFDFDLAQAVMEQMVAAFDSLPSGRLSAENLLELRRTKGVYQLFMGEELVYVGKAGANIQKRLIEHSQNLAARQNIDVALIGFKALYLHRNWEPMYHESYLIERYRSRLGTSEWNTSGFGNHDPGRRREETNKPPDGFDSRYPIKPDFPCVGVVAQTWNVRELLMAMKNSLPFTFRYEVDHPKQWQRGSAAYNELEIAVPQPDMAVKDLLKLIVDDLPDTWQATIFPSHIILYREEKNYSHAVEFIRRLD